jgi:hypothetical protein
MIIHIVVFSEKISGDVEITKKDSLSFYQGDML